MKKTIIKVFPCKYHASWMLFGPVVVSAVTSLYTHSLETSLRNETFIDNAYNKDTRPATKTAIKCNIKLLSLKDIVSSYDNIRTKCAKFLLARVKYCQSVHNIAICP